MNTGIQHAVNLGWELALACCGANSALLDSYEPECAPVGRVVLRMSDRAFTIAATRTPIIRLARTHPSTPVPEPFATAAPSRRHAHWVLAV